MFKQYLGDGVYVGWDGHYVVLTVGEGHEIFLEPAVLVAFERCLAELATELEQQRQARQESGQESGHNGPNGEPSE